MTVEPRDANNPAGVTLDKAPPAPEPKRALASELHAGKGGAGGMGSSPQIRALNGLKQVELGFRDLSVLMPDIAPQLGDLMQQLEPLVVAKVQQMTTGQGPAVPPGIMQPPPMAAPPPGPPPGAAPGPPGM